MELHQRPLHQQVRYISNTEEKGSHALSDPLLAVWAWVGTASFERKVIFGYYADAILQELVSEFCGVVEADYESVDGVKY